MVSQSSKSVFAAAMNLPASERKALIEELLRTMESERTEELEKGWLIEISSRWDAFKDGRLVAEPIESLLGTLQLSQGERIELARQLWLSVDDEAREGTTSPWEQEIDRRIARARRDPACLVDGDEVLRKLDAGQRP